LISEKRLKSFRNVYCCKTFSYKVNFHTFLIIFVAFQAQKGFATILQHPLLQKSIVLHTFLFYAETIEGSILQLLSVLFIL